MRRRYFLLFIFILACKKDLDITEFSKDFSDYKPELRIEALILPGDSTAIVRIDKSFLITDTELYDCRDNDFGEISLDSCNTIEGIWHGIEGIDTIADCGNWNSFLHDIGSDGKMSIDENGDGKYEGSKDIAPDDDGTENNGSPDCGEPNVDNYAEILPGIHDSLCDVSINKISNNLSDTCNFHFEENAGQFLNYMYTGNNYSPIFDNLESVTYGGYRPDNCNDGFWSDYDAQYELNCDCSGSGFGIIESKEPILLSKPVVYFNVQDSLNIIECLDYSCLKNTTSLLNGTEYDSLYFGRYSTNFINYASISPNVTFQIIKYMYDKRNEKFKYLHGHGHAAVGTEMFHIVNAVCVMRWKIISDYYDGVGNGEWDEGELFEDNIINNNTWDSTEYFIDLGDDSLDVNTYYYKIFTFSESYKNYYYYDLSLDDPERTNLRDQNGNPVMGAFGSMTSEKINYRIINCTYFNKAECENNDITHSVCEWREYISLKPEQDYEGPLCLPVNY